jgi:RHS repeat-associated protein
VVFISSWHHGIASARGDESASLKQATRIATAAAAQPVPNRTLPPHSAANPALALPDNSSEADLRQVRLFAEPLVPVGRTPAAQENGQLAAVLRPHGQRAAVDDFSHLEQFITNHPDSPWAPALTFNLGMDYYNTGLYSKALAAWEKAWAVLKNATDPAAKPLGDRAAGELAMMYARLGRVDDLSAFLASVEGRAFVGSATERITGAKELLWTMQNRPDVAFRCGPTALDRIRAEHSNEAVGDLLAYKAHSTAKGYSLAQLARLSLDMGMNYRMAYRTNGAALLVPAVIHWKVGHFAALLKEEGGLYFLQDSTFGGGLSVSRRVLEAESSGYFLIPSGGNLPAGWRPVNEAEASAVWGKGPTSNNDPKSTTAYDPTTSCPGPNQGPGMAVQSVHLLEVSLNIEDSPVGYTPPVGPRANLRLTYNQRDAGQPAIFSYSNLGPKWTFNWLAFISDNPGSPSADVNYYTDGGGILPFTGYNSGSQTYANQIKSQALLTRTSASSYEMLFPDGAMNIFSQPDSTNGTSRRVFLTRVVDRYGNYVQISYDASFRVAALTDAISQVTVFSYTNASDPLKITQVSDPFGRFATFAYDGNGRLTNITDCANLSSQFGYDAGDFIQSMTTPYGTTSFAKGESGRTRWLEVTHPTGEKERVEFSESTSVGISASDPANTVPAGINTINNYLYYRDTYYWDRKAYSEAAGDYTKARLYHWLHSTDWSTVMGVLESEKLPLENRVWYNYDGQPSSIQIGSTSLPNAIGRVLDDGTTQLRRFKYNALGHITNSVDPVGRSMTYVYAANLVDLLEVRQTTGTNNELIAKFAYNSQHLPLRTWDAAGQLTTNSYSARGQLLTTTNPKNETTTLTYDTNGYLFSIDGPLPGTNDTTSFTYDAVGRAQTVTGPDGYTLAYGYDNLDRLTNITYPDGTFEAFTYERLDRVRSRDRMGREAHYTYDAFRHLESLEDPLHHVTRFDYCGCGAMTGLVDPMGRRTSWNYDIQGRLAAKNYVDGSRILYTYENTTSRLKSVQDEKGQIKAYDYYADDNRRRVSYPIAQLPTPTVTFTYDTNYSRMISMQDGIGLTTWSYYPAGVFGALKVASVDGPWENDTVNYYYDALGRVINRSINGAAQTYAYDPLGRATNVVNALGSFTYAFDGATPRVRDVSYPNSQTSHYDYFDNLRDRRLQRIAHLKPDSSLISRFTYAYNPFGNITNWVQEMGPLTETWEIGYDDADQLLNVLADQGGTNTISYNYGYDPAGNRLFEDIDGIRRSFDYNALNQLVSSSDATVTNIVYEWDAEQRLAAVSRGTQRNEFAYDGFGRRVRILERTNGVVQSDNYFLWCGAQIREERDSTGATVLRRLYPQGEALVGSAGSTNYYYTRDHLGSVREALDPNGLLSTRYDYDPYGQRQAIHENLRTTFAFAGYFVHFPSGLYLTLYRPFDGSVGRWPSRDPIGERGGLNLYFYCANNPLNYKDPFGLDKQCDGSGGNNKSDPNTSQIGPLQPPDPDRDDDRYDPDRNPLFPRDPITQQLLPGCNWLGVCKGHPDHLELPHDTEYERTPEPVGAP